MTITDYMPDIESALEVRCQRCHHPHNNTLSYRITITSVWCRAGSSKVLSHNKQSCKLYHAWYTSVNHVLQLGYFFCIHFCRWIMYQNHCSISHVSVFNPLTHLPVRSTFTRVWLPNAPSVCYPLLFQGFLCFECSYSSLVAVERP